MAMVREEDRYPRPVVREEDRYSRWSGRRTGIGYGQGVGQVFAVVREEDR